MRSRVLHRCTHVSQSLSTELDKWEFVGLKARGILSPSGRHNNSPAWSRHAAERWVKRRTYQNPERSERVAACHGVGRKPGDGKSLLHNKLRPPCHPSTLVGVPVIFYSKPRVPPLTRLHSGLWLYRPDGLKIPLR